MKHRRDNLPPDINKRARLQVNTRELGTSLTNMHLISNKAVSRNRQGGSKMLRRGNAAATIKDNASTIRKVECRVAPDLQPVAVSIKGKLTCLKDEPANLETTRRSWGRVPREDGNVAHGIRIACAAVRTRPVRLLVPVAVRGTYPSIGRGECARGEREHPNEATYYLIYCMRNLLRARYHNCTSLFSPRLSAGA